MTGGNSPPWNCPGPKCGTSPTKGGDILFVKNPYETRRMQYTIYNALGEGSSAWKNGKLLATIQLTIPADLDPYTASMWPWHASDLEELVHSRPNSEYCIEAWDYYLNGVFHLLHI